MNPRRLIEWVLWSPRNAVMAGTVVLAVLIVFGMLMASGGSAPAAHTKTVAQATTAATTPEPTSTETDMPWDSSDNAGQDPVSTTPEPRPWEITASPATGSPSTGEVDETPADAEAVAKEAEQAARDFTNAWLFGRVWPRDQWLAEMKKKVAPELVEFFEATPSTAIPAADFKATENVDMGADYGTVDVVLSNGAKFRLELMQRQAGTQTALAGLSPWVVAGVTPL